MNKQQEYENTQFFVQQLQANQDEAVIKIAVKKLGEMSCDNLEAIEALINLIQTTQDEPTRWIGIESLSKIGAKNNDVIHVLIGQICNGRIPTRRIASQNLAKIIIDNLEARKFLVAKVKIAEDRFTCQYLAYTLARVEEVNEDVVNALIELIYKSSDNYTLKNCVDGLIKSKYYYQDKILNAIIKVVMVAQDYNTYYYTRCSLRQYLEKIGISVAVNFSSVRICELMLQNKSF
ncbi:HEAT repeat-containing PBS lyase [Calothrix sp. NIES-4071]|nr:HEAT repeat-containing PBS lyase [Calothrix sp. NIES-4071]BAZ54497.1 HEAT repeat-containing PBS lyase [Calothrix sp. NIES-4105]